MSTFYIENQISALLSKKEELLECDKVLKTKTVELKEIYELVEYWERQLETLKEATRKIVEDNVTLVQQTEVLKAQITELKRIKEEYVWQCLQPKEEPEQEPVCWDKNDLV